MLYFLVGMVRCHPVCDLLPTFSPTAVSLLLYSSCCPPPPIPLDTTRGERAALPTQLCIILVPLHHEPFGCFEDPPVPLPRLFCCSGPQRGLNSKHRGGKFRCPFDVSEVPKVFDYASMSSLKMCAKSRVHQPSSRTLPD